MMDKNIKILKIYMRLFKIKQAHLNKYKIKYNNTKMNIIKILIIQKNYRTLIIKLNNIILNYKRHLIIIYLKII